jgi:hypothetical protein
MLKTKGFSACTRNPDKVIYTSAKEYERRSKWTAINASA